MSHEAESTLSVHELKSREGLFLHQVYEKSLHMIRSEKDAITKVHIKNQAVDRWGFERQDLQIIEAHLLESENHDYGLLLGFKGFEVNREDRLVMEFGRISHHLKGFDERLQHYSINKEGLKINKELDYLDFIVNQDKIGGNGSGRFYVMDGVEVDCWADKLIFGGDEVGRYPWGSKEGTVSDVYSYVDIVRRVMNRSWL